MFSFSLKRRIEELERRANLTDKSIEQLFCPHQEFMPRYYLIGPNYSEWVKECSECKRSLKLLKSETEKLKDEKSELEGFANKITQKLEDISS